MLIATPRRDMPCLFIILATPIFFRYADAFFMLLIGMLMLLFSPPPAMLRYYADASAALDDER